MWPFRRRKASLSPTAQLGQRGERLAKDFLRRGGCKILAENYRCPAGEADLIVLDPSTRNGGAETLVFVEVKTRRCDRYSDPESAVDAAKQRHIRNVARDYLSSRNASGFNLRFDIVSVVIPQQGDVRIKHIPDAF